jgi:hypothetical protein
LILGTVHLRRKISAVARAANSALAVSLAILLIGLGLLAASGPLHRSLHHDKPVGSSLCAVCLLAQGHVDAADIAPLFVFAALIFLCGVLAANAVLPSRFDFLLPPGRAPPRVHLPAVVAG